MKKRKLKAALLGHIDRLASDELEGRAPGTRGEQRTIEYIAGQLEKFGVTPAGDNGTYFQSMPVTGIISLPELELRTGDWSKTLEFAEDFVGQSRHPGACEQAIKVDSSELVFVGYGIEAPEYGWNDYEGVDVRGKTVVILIGQPERPDPRFPLEEERLDPNLFKGRTLTYYGRWTYKFEKASEMGAAAALIIHDGRKAGYGFDVVQASWSGECYQLSCPADRVLLEGWLSAECAGELFSRSGHDLDSLKMSANEKGFKAVSLGSSASFRVANKLRTFESNNVLARVEGCDPVLKDECIIYSAHWDHFGLREREDGGSDVYSGAVDNGSGVSMILEIAGLFQSCSVRPKRSVLFLFTTLEESGLLGADFYVANPSMPLDATVSIINLDVMNVWGRTRELVSIALGHSSLDENLSRLAAGQGRRVVPDPEPEKGYFFRSDHMSFLKEGIPALFFLFPGSDYIDREPGYAEAKKLDYIRNHYHKPSDKVKDDWDLSGTVEDVELLFEVGQELVSSDTRPYFAADSEFKTRWSRA